MGKRVETIPCCPAGRELSQGRRRPSLLEKGRLAVEGGIWPAGSGGGGAGRLRGESSSLSQSWTVQQMYEQQIEQLGNFQLRIHDQWKKKRMRRLKRCAWAPPRRQHRCIRRGGVTAATFAATDMARRCFYTTFVSTDQPRRRSSCPVAAPQPLSLEQEQWQQLVVINNLSAALESS